MHDVFPGARWHGHWIAADLPEFAVDPTSMGGDLEPHPFSRVLFRKRFALDAVPEAAPARMTADSRYVIRVNGSIVGRGPIRSQPRRLRYDEVDLAPYLQRGENVIAVLVTYFGHANSYWQPAASSGVMGRDAQFVFEARLSDDDWLVSDASWRALRSTAWTAPASGLALTGVPVELLDARALDADWAAIDYDDDAWVDASVVRATHDGALAESRPPVDPYGPMLPRGIGQLGGELIAALGGVLQRTEPVTDDLEHPSERVVAALRGADPAEEPVTLPLVVQLDADRSSVLSVDFGRIVAGHVEFEIDAPAGTRLDLFYQEAFEFDAVNGPVESAPRTSATYIARGAQDRYEAVDLNGLRRISLLLPPGEGSVTIASLGVREHHYPFVGAAGFASSDHELETLYRAGIRTTEMNSFDAFTDCPTREQRAWVGDGVVHQMVHLVANEDWRLAANYVTLGASPRADGILPMTVVGEVEHGGGYTIPDWSLHWVHAVHNLFRYQGDAQAIAPLLPVVERVLRWFEPYIDEHGTLSDVPEWNLIDWSSIFSSHRSSLITGLWARGLTEFAEMSEWLGNRGDAAWARARIEGARSGYEAFWDEARGSYVDHIVDGERKPALSQAAGAVAIVSGLAPEHRWARIASVITDEERLVTRSWIGGADGGYDMQKIREQAEGVYRIDWDADREIVRAEPFFSYVVHDAVARAGDAAKLTDLVRRWSVFLHHGYDTFGECWGWGTPVHAWSATPTKDLIWYVLGVTPDEPGFASARIAPRPGDVSMVSGTVPTPHGPISVEVREGVVSVDSPVPVRFVASDGSETSVPAGRATLEL